MEFPNEEEAGYACRNLLFEPLNIYCVALFFALRPEIVSISLVHVVHKVHVVHSGQDGQDGQDGQHG